MVMRPHNRRRRMLMRPYGQILLFGRMTMRYLMPCVRDRQQISGLKAGGYRTSIMFAVLRLLHVSWKSFRALMEGFWTTRSGMKSRHAQQSHLQQQLLARVLARTLNVVSVFSIF